LYDVSLTDDELGAITLTGLTDEDGDGFEDDLAVGAFATGSATGTLDQQDIDDEILTNIADVTSLDPDGVAVEDTDTNTVNPEGDPLIDLIKTNTGIEDTDLDGRDSVGDEIDYSYSVQNTGNQTLYDVSLTDDELGAITLTGLTDEDGDGFEDDLAVGAFASGTATGALDQQDIDDEVLTNIADVSRWCCR